MAPENRDSVGGVYLKSSRYPYRKAILEIYISMGSTSLSQPCDEVPAVPSIALLHIIRAFRKPGADLRSLFQVGRWRENGGCQGLWDPQVCIFWPEGIPGRFNENAGASAQTTSKPGKGSQGLVYCWITLEYAEYRRKSNETKQMARGKA